MIVLHAGVYDGRFMLWGEAPTGSDAHRLRRRGRQSQMPQPEDFPYDAGADALLAVLAAAGAGATAGKGQAETAVAWLPTVDNTPVASSPLVAEPPASSTKTVLAPWAVTVLPLSTEQTVEVLCACVGKQMLALGVIVGKDLAFWTAVMRCAGALVARQQFLPGITEEPPAYRACWKPVFAGADANRLAMLAKTMPHVGRALSRDADSPPETPAVSVLSTFVNALVDHFVRMTGAVPAVLQSPAPRRTRKAPVFDSVHDQWLHALRSSEGLMQGDATTLAEFAAQVHAWQHPVTVSTATPFRLCFRLEEPGDNGHSTDGAWYVRYLLQAADDPSLLIPAPDAWRAKGRRATLLQRGGFNAREYLLMSLGQAAGVCPGIEDSLKASAPGGYGLDATGAYAFLTAGALLLEQAGFGVMLPAWWTRKGTRLRLSVRANVKSPKMRGGSGLSLNTVVQFDWEVALGSERLTREELEELARLKAPLVQVRGQWVQMSAEEIQAALAFWKQQAAQQATAREVVQMALGAGKTPEALAFEGVTATGWMADLLAQLEGRTAFAGLPAPDGFQGTLRPYQVRGYSWLGFLRRWGLGACLADDMGLGKTPQTLALIQHDWQANGKRPVLVVCPTSVVSNWQKEATRFTPDLPVMVHHGTTRSKGARFKKQAQQQAIVISSYALLHRDFDILKQVPWAGVILDEAQNIKNPETKQAKAARALPAEYRLALTGTPVENNVGDLWSIMEFLNPGFFGTQTEFKRRFFVPIQASRDADAVARLKRLTGPFILRRLKTDKAIIADLPDKLEMKVFCTLTREQASLYTAVVRDAERDLEAAEGMRRRGLILATLSKLKQVCNHPAQFLGDNSSIPDRSGKLARLTEMLEEVLAVGERALVFTQFAEMGALLQRYLQETFGREVLFLHGGVRKAQRDRMVARFQAEGDGPSVFLLSLKAGGTGLNLTRANHVFHFDRWWNPAVENQATDRAFRIGQTKHVQVHKFLCVGTLEERIDEMLERKQELAEGVVGSGEAWLTELSTAELKALFALRQDAIGE